MPNPTQTITKLVRQANPLSHLSSILHPRKVEQIGAAPGLTPQQIAEQHHGQREPAEIAVIDYGGGRCERVDRVGDLPALLEQGRPDWASVRWINVVGLNDPAALAALAEHYDLHPLAMEDVVHASQRPKVETYGQPEIGRPRYFLVARMLYREGQPVGEATTAGRLVSEQISVFAGPHTVITIQQRRGDVWEPMRERIKNPASRFHERGPGYLLYALMDAVVDALFPLLDGYAEQIDAIEEQILINKPDNDAIHRVHQLKRDLMLLRREAWPMRELIRSMLDQDTTLMDEQTRLFLRDVGDHAIAALELVETYRELTQGLAEAWMTAMSNRMNEAMKVLTIIASIFIPISFLAGVFGMNFDDVPGLHTRGAFAFFCIACLGICVGMLLWFKRRGWL